MASRSWKWELYYFVGVLSSSDCMTVSIWMRSGITRQKGFEGGLQQREIPDISWLARAFSSGVRAKAVKLHDFNLFWAAPICTTLGDLDHLWMSRGCPQQWSCKMCLLSKVPDQFKLFTVATYIDKFMNKKLVMRFACIWGRLDKDLTPFLSCKQEV